MAMANVGPILIKISLAKTTWRAETHRTPVL